MSDFMSALSILSMGDTKPKEKSATNYIHFMTVLARTYSKVARVYNPAKEYNMDSDIYNLIIQNNLLSLCEHKGVIADCDVVNIFESVRWSIIYLQSGMRCNLKPVSIVDSTNKNEMPSKLYNAFLCDLENRDTSMYFEYSYFKKGSVLSILNVSDTIMQPTFEEA